MPEEIDRVLNHEQDTYGQQGAQSYDRMHPGVLCTDDAVRTLSQLAGSGPVLELGVGTGRLAIPLAELGFSVHGVDVAAAMLERLAAKPGGHLVHTVRGDFADLGGQLDLSSTYQLAYVAADTLFMLTSQDEQVGCFRTVARRLSPNGRFVVEAFVPGRGVSTNGGVAVRKVNADSVVLGLSVHDPHLQLINGQQIVIDAEGVHMVPGVLRYAWPSELDLMAELAGFRLESRWGNWQQEPFTAQNLRHVSVYTRKGNRTRNDRG